MNSKSRETANNKIFKIIIYFLIENLKIQIQKIQNLVPERRIAPGGAHWTSSDWTVGSVQCSAGKPWPSAQSPSAQQTSSEGGLVAGHFSLN